MSEPKFDHHDRLDLAQQKKRAKELRNAVRDGKADALARVLRHHPQAAGLDAAAIPTRFDRLCDAQLVVARELGLPSWPKLKAHIEQLASARAAIRDGAPAPDGDCRTLHVRCGSDLREPLKRAGFVGEFLEVSDPLCQGPVPREGDLMRIRARFLAEQFEIPYATIESDYARTLQTLAGAPGRYARIILWFEHDSYDQLILARLLSEFAAWPATGPTLELICIDRFPAVARFLGLGQLPPAALRLLWDSRTAVTPAQLRLGTAVWNALQDPSPMALYALAAGATPELPVMAPALQRHLQELPWTRDGLGLTQHLALQQLQTGPQRAFTLFQTIQMELEPLPFLGDSMFWAELRAMARAARPPFETTPESAALPWPQRLLSLNAVGTALLAGQLDWLTLQPPDRWVGGVRIVAGTRAWRWDDNRGLPLLR